MCGITPLWHDFQYALHPAIAMALEEQQTVAAIVAVAAWRGWSEADGPRFGAQFLIDDDAGVRGIDDEGMRHHARFLRYFKFDRHIGLDYQAARLEVIIAADEACALHAVTVKVRCYAVFRVQRTTEECT